MVSLGEQVVKSASHSVSAYESYILAIHYRDFPDTVHIPDDPELGFSPMSFNYLRTGSENDFKKILRSRLAFTLGMALNATNAPQSLWQANEHSEIVPTMQSYLVEIVGVLAIRSLAEDNIVTENTKLSDLANPFQNVEVLRSIWRYRQDERFIKGLTSLDDLAPGYTFTAF